MNISWLLLSRKLAEAFLHPSTKPLLEKTKGGCFHTYVKTAIKSKNYFSWGLGPRRTVWDGCWMLGLQGPFISSFSLIVRRAMFTLVIWMIDIMNFLNYSNRKNLEQEFSVGVTRTLKSLNPCHKAVLETSDVAPRKN